MLFCTHHREASKTPDKLGFIVFSLRCFDAHTASHVFSQLCCVPCALSVACQPYGLLVLHTLETMAKTTQKIFRHALICKIHRPVFTTRLEHGFQVTSLLWKLLWLSVGKDSHLPIQPVLHVIHIHGSSIPLRRLDTYTPTELLRLTGFIGSPSIPDTELDYWGPSLITTSDIPSRVRSRV